MHFSHQHLPRYSPGTQFAAENADQPAGSVGAGVVWGIGVVWGDAVVSFAWSSLLVALLELPPLLELAAAGAGVVMATGGETGFHQLLFAMPLACDTHARENVSKAH